MEKIPMQKEDREYFKNGVKTLCGIEMLATSRFIDANRKIFAEEDYEYMKLQLGRRAGAIWAELLRALKKMDFEAAQNILTGGKSE